MEYQHRFNYIDNGIQNNNQTNTEFYKLLLATQCRSIYKIATQCRSIYKIAEH